MTSHLEEDWIKEMEPVSIKKASVNENKSSDWQSAWKQTQAALLSKDRYATANQATQALSDLEENETTATTNRNKSAKPRRATTKLDCARLLNSQTGLARLLEMASQLPQPIHQRGQSPRLALQQLLTLYQTWSHTLEPRWPLKDVAKRVETVCRERAMRIYLMTLMRQWKYEKSSLKELAKVTQEEKGVSVVEEEETQMTSQNSQVNNSQIALEMTEEQRERMEANRREAILRREQRIKAREQQELQESQQLQESQSLQESQQNNISVQSKDLLQEMDWMG